MNYLGKIRGGRRARRRRRDFSSYLGIGSVTPPVLAARETLCVRLRSARVPRCVFLQQTLGVEDARSHDFGEYICKVPVTFIKNLQSLLFGSTKYLGTLELYLTSLPRFLFLEEKASLAAKFF
jgi:hypothetical protein